MQIKKGDLVIVRDDLELDKYYGSFAFNEDKAKYEGTVSKVRTVDHGDDSFTLQDCEGGLWWTSGMVKKLPENQNKENLKPGDKVKIKEDLSVGNFYGNDTFVNNMRPLRGKIVEIEELISRSNKYAIIEDDHNKSWTPEMIDYVVSREEEEETEEKYPVYYKEVQAKKGNLEEYNYDAILDPVNSSKKRVIQTDTWDDIIEEMIIGEDVVTKEKAIDLKKKYHKEELQRLS